MIFFQDFIFFIYFNKFWQFATRNMTSIEIASDNNSERDDDDAGAPRLAGLPDDILAAIVGFAADLPTRLLRRPRPQETWMRRSSGTPRRQQLLQTS